MPATLLLALLLAPPPDRIFVNGTVVTLDARNRVVQAVSVRSGRIAAAGSDSDIRAAAGQGTEVIDLKGKTLLPGFYAAHDHLPQAGMLALYQVDLNSPPIGSMRSMGDVLVALRARAGRTPAGRWIVGRGYDDTLLAERRHPNRRDLDSVSTAHPIWVVHTSGHLGAANSSALAIAGITRDSPQPRGGVIRKDRVTGEPDGVIEESLSLVARHLPAETREQRLEAIRWCDRTYRQKGVTTSVIAGATLDRMEELREAFQRGWLNIRVRPMLAPAAAGGAGHDVKDRIHTGAVKLFHDGSIQGYTGFLGAPYYRQPEGKADYRGYPSRSREELTAMVKKHHRAGLQVCVHGNGDAAIDDILHAYGEAQREFPRRDARHRIEHCQTPRPDQLDAMRELGVTPSYFNGHVYYWGDRHRDIFLGPERAARISPLRSSLDRGIRFTLHNDTPVTPVDPLLLVWAAVNRMTRNGQVLGPAERISVEQALRAVTIDAAWQNFEENDRGSIETGKLADFTILEMNPLAVPQERIRDIRVAGVVIGGQPQPALQ
jgi:hypothetical protein